MPQIFIPRIIRAIIIAKDGGGNTMLNVFHCAAPEPGVTLDQVNTVLTTTAGWINSDYQNAYNSDILITAVHGRSMEGMDVPQNTLPVNLAGNLIADDMPNVTTLPVELITNLTGIASHGMFYPFAPNEEVNESPGRPTAAYRAVVGDMVETLRGALNDAGLPLVVASFEYAQFNVVTAVLANTQWGTQNRRKPGRGA